MTIDWFRKPTADTEGTLNACYNAVDIHVIRGRAEDIALLDGERSLTYAWLLTEVGACAGVLHAFGIKLGDEVVALDLPPLEDTVLELACARVGAVLFREPSEDPGLVVLGTDRGAEFGAAPRITVDDSGELDWPTAMRAGRTDPAGCADVPGAASLRVVDGVPVPVAEHLLAVAAGTVTDPVLSALIPGRTLVLAGPS